MEQPLTYFPCSPQQHARRQLLHFSQCSLQRCIWWPLSPFSLRSLQRCARQPLHFSLALPLAMCWAAALSILYTLPSTTCPMAASSPHGCAQLQCLLYPFFLLSAHAQSTGSNEWHTSRSGDSAPLVHGAHSAFPIYHYHRQSPLSGHQPRPLGFDRSTLLSHGDGHTSLKLSWLHSSCMALATFLSE